MVITRHFVKHTSTGVVYLNSSIIPKKDTTFLYLLYDASLNHFDLITSMKAFLERNYWCDYCKIAFMNKNTHRCKFVCNSCRSFNCDNSSVDRFPKPLQCENCSKLLFSDACTLTHLLEFCKKAKR